MAEITIIAKNNSIVVNGLQCEKGRLSIAVSDDTILVNNLNGNLSEVTINGNSYGTMQEFVDAADELLFENGGGAPGEGVQSVTGDLVDNTDTRNPVVNLPTDVHSSGEDVTNKIWINGKNIYRRVFHNEVIEDDGLILISLAGTGITEVTHFDYTVNEDGVMRKSVDTLDVNVTNTSLSITPTGVPSVPTSVSIILEYTK